MKGVRPRSGISGGLTLKYDAWNRLVAVQVSQSAVAKYAYDGLHRRTIKLLDTTTVDIYNYCYHNAPWQLLAFRALGDTIPISRKN